MSTSKQPLHGAALLAALTETALEVQRARRVDDAVQAMGRGLERLGFEVALVAMTKEHYWLRSLTKRPLLEALAGRAGLGPGQRKPVDREGAIYRAAEHAEPVLLDDVPAAVRVRYPELRGADLGGLPPRGALIPLNVRSAQWGVLFVMGEVHADDLAALRLFSLQVGSAIDVAENFEQLEHRNAELNLVHEVTVAGPAADSRALCRRALETVARTTRSDAGMLHRYDTDKGEFVLVGDAWGYEGPLVEQFRRFTLPADHLLSHQPLATAARALPDGARELAAEGMAQLAIVPLAIEGKPVGMLTLARRFDEAYATHEVRSAEILGVQMASLLERARLYDETSRLYDDLKTSYDDLARAQQELVRHERLAALGELAAVMAHEVRNPLGVIFNSLTTLKRLLKPEGDAEMLLNMVGEEADRLNRIVGDLLDFVRPYELMKKPVAVEPIIASAVDAATQSALHTGVRVTTELPKELPPFPLDAHLLKQALVNLVVNAAQSMPRGGNVLVRAAMEPVGAQRWLTVHVCDEGVGLTPRAAEKMFQPFFTTKATGTGLGLAVVKRIVEAHLGEVSARPNESGVGTTFTVRFPPTSDTRSGALTPPRPSPAAPRRR